MSEPTLTARVESRALLLLAGVLALLVGLVLFVMSARGVFTETQALVLRADNSEGVTVGMDLSFSGFPIGRVTRIELAEDGKAHIHVEVPVADIRWLRSSSVFTLERGVVGGAKLRAFTGLLDDPPLPQGALRDVLIGDATSGIPQLVATMHQLIENLARMTADQSALNASLANVHSLSATLATSLKGRQGALPLLLGEPGAQQIRAALERSNRLLAQTEARLYGSGGLADGVQQSLQQVNGLLAEVRSSLKKADAALDAARAIAVNAQVATTDLDALRDEVDATLRRVAGMVETINQKWPFAQPRELNLP